MNRYLDSRLGLSILLLSAAFASAQGTLPPDQFEPNDTLAQARPFRPPGTAYVIGHDPGLAAQVVQATFHDATDMSDWYRIEVTTTSFLANPEYTINGDAHFDGCYPLAATFEATASGFGSDAEYVVTIAGDSPPSLPADPPRLPATGRGSVRAEAQTYMLSCAFVRFFFVEVRRGAGAPANEAYTLAIAGHGIIPPAPTIASIAPTHGPPGTEVTINGSNLGWGAIVFGPLGPSWAGIVHLQGPYSNLAASVTVKVPANAPTGAIHALTQYGGFDAVSSQVFTVDPPPAPSTPPFGSTSQRGGTEPQPPASRAPSASGCCTVAVNPALKGGLGRVVIGFPGGTVPTATRVLVLKDGKQLQAGYGNRSWELPPGSYEVSISGKVVSNVTVQAGADTNVRVGVLRVTASNQTRSEIIDGATPLAAGFGTRLVGLPVGSYGLRISGQTEPNTIQEGQVTQF